MAERIKVKAAVGYELMGIGELLVDKLIEDGKLPHDFDFRALGIERGKSHDVIRADVMAAIGYGDGSGDPYLTGPLPDCVLIPDIEEQTDVMKRVDDDYYRLADLKQVGQDIKIHPVHVYNNWAAYITTLNPKLAEFVGLGALETRSRYQRDKIRRNGSALNKIIIRDEALLGLYAEKYRTLGRGAIDKLLLHGLLRDNHREELATDLD